MWNPFKNYRERKAAEAKRIAAVEAQRQADKLKMLNAAIAAARKPAGFFDRAPTLQDRQKEMQNELNARRAYREDMQRRAQAEDTARSNLNNEADILNVMQAQAFISSIQTSSSDSYTPAGSCANSTNSTNSTNSDDSSPSTSSSSDCSSSSSDSSSSGGGDW